MKLISNYFVQLHLLFFEYWKWSNAFLAAKRKRQKVNMAIKIANTLTQTDRKKRWVVDDPTGNPVPLNRNQIIELQRRNILPKITFMDLSKRCYYETKF